MENRIAELAAAALPGAQRSSGRLAHARHLVRLAAILVALAAASVIARALLLPATFGQKGHYRAAAEAEIAALPVRHLGDSACAGCHQHRSLAQKHRAGKHRSVACESCHGPGQDHAAASARGHEAMAVDASSGLCLRCHSEVLGRPKSFPQVDARKHLAAVSGEASEASATHETPEAPGTSPAEQGAAAGTCTSCHDAHEPSV